MTNWSKSQCPPGKVLFDCLIVWLFDCLIVWLFDCLIVWLFDCLILTFLQFIKGCTFLSNNEIVLWNHWGEIFVYAFTPYTNQSQQHKPRIAHEKVNLTFKQVPVLLHKLVAKGNTFLLDLLILYSFTYLYIFLYLILAAGTPNASSVHVSGRSVFMGTSEGEIMQFNIADTTSSMLGNHNTRAFELSTVRLGAIDQEHLEKQENVEHLGFKDNKENQENNENKEGNDEKESHNQDEIQRALHSRKWSYFLIRDKDVSVIHPCNGEMFVLFVTRIDDSFFIFSVFRIFCFYFPFWSHACDGWIQRSNESHHSQQCG